MKKQPLALTALALATVLAAVSLASCAPATPQAAPTQDPNEIATAAVQTFEAGITATAAAQPTGTPVPSKTLAPAATNTPSAPQAPTATYYIAPPDKASFVGQKPLDGAQVGILEKFDVSWTLRNDGKTTWTKQYSLRYYSGASLGERTIYYFPKEVPPGEEIKLIVDMVAPNYTATLNTNWVLANADGAAFFPVYLQVQIVNGPTVTPTPTPTFTPTPGPSPTKVIG